MNKEFLNQLSPEDQSVSEVMQSQAQSIRVNPQFQSNLEARLKQAHPENKQPERGTGIKILPAIGWAVVAIAAFLVLNWAVRSLVPNMQPAANGTPDPDSPFETGIDFNNMCTGQLAAAHGFSVSLTNQEKTGFIALDAENNIGELRSFALSPDGNQLAIVGNTRGSGNLYLMDPMGTQLQPVLADSQLGYLVGAAWAHDGSRLLTWEIENNKRLYLVNKDGTGLTRIDLPVRFSETPQFVPDDESILFFGADDSTGGLFRVTIDGLQVELVSNLVEDDSSFAWSPDGSRLAYIEMDRDLGEARLVVESEGNKSTIAAFQIPRGSGSSLPNSANLSWSPDGQSLVFELGRNAGDRAIYLAYLDGTEPLKLAESAHAPAISSDGNCLAFIRNQQLFLLNLTTVSPTALPTPLLLADLPAGRGQAYFQLDKLGWGSQSTAEPDTQSRNIPTPTPSGADYDWRGTKLSLGVPLPEAPAEANVYQFQPEQPATLESARRLAQHFGLEEKLYEIPPGIGYSDKTSYLVADGNQQLQVNSNLNFSFYLDYNRLPTIIEIDETIDPDLAENLIDDFLRAYRFGITYDVRVAYLSDNFEAIQLTPDGFAIHHAFFHAPGFSFDFSEDEIVSVFANLVDYAPIGSFEIISPETALQRLVDHNTIYGVHVYTNSDNAPPSRTWQRSYPENQTITVWGPITSVKSMDGMEPLVTFDGYQATGNLEGLADFTPPTLIEATGQFLERDGVKTFNIESWKIYDEPIEWKKGDIRLDAGQVIFTDSNDLRLVISDVPDDLPLPFEKAFVRGVIRGNVFEWKYIDNHLKLDGGPVGRGFTSQFHKLNLTGMPIPLATPMLNQNNAATGGRTNYSGQTGVIEVAELAYYVPNPYMFLPRKATTEPVYLQPVWRFYGHFSGGDEFEILVQALKDEFLSPELGPGEP